MADAIRFVLTNLPAVLFVLAILIASVRRDQPVATRFLSWLLLLSVGVESVWGGLFHIFAPQTAAASIGWQVSPFQFEMGISDVATGVVAIMSFWRGYPFKAAIGLVVILIYAGVAIGHFREAFEHANYSANNFGVLLLLTVVKVFLLSALLLKSRHEMPNA